MPQSESDIMCLLRRRASFASTISAFRTTADSYVMNALSEGSRGRIEQTELEAWQGEIDVLRDAFRALPLQGLVAFEFTVPRIGRRIDVLVVLDRALLVIEFKVGAAQFASAAIAQAWDYALDLKNFHSTSHGALIFPILVATAAASAAIPATPIIDADGVARPLCASPSQLPDVIRTVVSECGSERIDLNEWPRGRYLPSPTIIEAAVALYGGHDVTEISRNDAEATNLTATSEVIDRVIAEAKSTRSKAICFVTGVPGAGKTLVGLNVATKYAAKGADARAVYLSGNGPLVAVLTEALARDKRARCRAAGEAAHMGEMRRQVRAFIQNVHHFRDSCIADDPHAPPDHIAIFDEAQRAWNQKQTSSFMQRKKDLLGFAVSEPEYLISCMDRHPDWSVIICLVGGGQEIHTGEAGIGEWISAVTRKYRDWRVYISPRLTDSEYAAGQAIASLREHQHVQLSEGLHLSVSRRSFRAEHVSSWVKAVLDLDVGRARELRDSFESRYPIVLSRNLATAKAWLRHKSRGTERSGLVVSSHGQRLKPLAIDVRAAVDPVHWFLHPRDDVRSSYYLEDAATEFQVQGLELDWTCVVWDGDFRSTKTGWDPWSFHGAKWKRVRAEDRQTYLKNAYRVLLTRARQGMAIVVPRADPADPTRSKECYDPTFEYLSSLGIPCLD